MATRNSVIRELEWNADINTCLEIWFSQFQVVRWTQGKMKGVTLALVLSIAAGKSLNSLGIAINTILNFYRQLADQLLEYFEFRWTTNVKNFKTLFQQVSALQFPTMPAPSGHQATHSQLETHIPISGFLLMNFPEVGQHSGMLKIFNINTPNPWFISTYVTKKCVLYRIISVISGLANPRDGRV